MAYSIGDDESWMIRNSIFYWMLDRLADDANEAVAPKLREVSDNNLGALWLDEFDESELTELSRLAHALPSIARRELPETSEREGIALRFEELAAFIDAGGERRR
ncbi:hypothetical protein GXB85_12845 [Cellulomonas sp. APG4]|uniref:hypothetical protein n=1 Tax=Cellulomonas sp. APG4 TaxID=1538656 RepID=UPI001379ED11|nr:hypothetical protein [Cellulomonas sp. APG4]NCT91833.1 hypothetical protein [Cellulomonas sp. APG4]